MDSRVTMMLAGGLLLGAAVAGYLGVALSREPAKAQAVEPRPAAAEPVEQIADVVRTPVVFAIRDLRPFTPVTREDLAVEQLRAAPPGSFQRIEDVLGRAPWGVVPAGTWLGNDHFEAGGPLSRMIRPDERALAVAVDEVIGGGGHLRPGDYVDVLLVMSADDARERTAQVAVPALRLLSYGEDLGPKADGRPASDAGKGKADQQEHRTPRTAVLAVPQGLVTRLMLASQAGTLRLAVRSSDEHLLTRYQAGDVQPVALDESTRSLLGQNQLAGRGPLPATAPSVRRQPEQASVEVVRGSQMARQIP